MAERCENLQGFFVYHALGGGTGSGFGTILLEQLSRIYGKKMVVNFPIYPSPKISTCVVEPYNVIFGASD